jgi:hypothetical protein
LRQDWPEPEQLALVEQVGAFSMAVMQKPPLPQTGPLGQAAQSSLVTQTVRQMPFTHCVPPLQSLVSSHSGLAVWSDMQRRVCTPLTVIAALQASLALAQVPEQIAWQVLLRHAIPEPQSLFFTHDPVVSGTQTELLQVWPEPQSSGLVQLDVHCPSRQTLPAPQ